MLPTKFRFIWPSGFRGEDFKKSANQKQELPTVASSFGWGVSEEKLKMWKANGRRTPSDGKSSHCLWQGELRKRCLRLTAASNKVNQLLAHGRWFSPGTPASSTTKTGRHDIAEILLKVALNTKNQSINQSSIKKEKKKLSPSFSSSTESHWTIQNLVSILDHIYHSALEIRDIRYR